MLLYQPRYAKFKERARGLTEKKGVCGRGGFRSSVMQNVLLLKQVAHNI